MRQTQNLHGLRLLPGHTHSRVHPRLDGSDERASSWRWCPRIWYEMGWNYPINQRNTSTSYPDKYLQNEDTGFLTAENRADSVQSRHRIERDSSTLPEIEEYGQEVLESKIWDRNCEARNERIVSTAETKRQRRRRKRWKKAGRLLPAANKRQLFQKWCLQLQTRCQQTMKKVKTSVKPLIRPLPHRNRRRETKEQVFSKGGTCRGSSFLVESSRNSVKSVSKRPQRIHRVTVGILPNVKRRNRKKVAASTSSVLLYEQNCLNLSRVSKAQNQRRPQIFREMFFLCIQRGVNNQKTSKKDGITGESFVVMVFPQHGDNFSRILECRHPSTDEDQFQRELRNMDIESIQYVQKSDPNPSGRRTPRSDRSTEMNSTSMEIVFLARSRNWQEMIVKGICFQRFCVLSGRKNVNRVHDREKCGNRRELFILTPPKSFVNSMTLRGGQSCSSVGSTQDTQHLSSSSQSNDDKVHPFNFKDRNFFMFI